MYTNYVEMGDVVEVRSDGCDRVATGQVWSVFWSWYR